MMALGDRTIGFDELRAEIHVVNHLPIGDLGQRLIDLENFAALRAEGFGPRENPHDQHLRFRQSLREVVG
jgi:hypothetical protein